MIAEIEGEESDRERWKAKKKGKDGIGENDKIIEARIHKTRARNGSLTRYILVLFNC